MAHLLLKLILPAILGLFALLALLRRLRPSLLDRLEATLGQRFWLVGATLAVAIYLASIALVTCLPVAVDAAEVTVSEISFLILRGHPAYTTLAAPERYSLLYGPMCYLPFAAAIATFGASIASVKFTVVALNLALLAVLFAVFRRLLGPAQGFIVTGALAASFIMQQMPTLQIRGDAALALAIACTLLAVEVRSRLPAILLFAAASACAVDIKFTAALYLLVPLYFLAKKLGTLPALATIPLAAALAALPFLFAPFSLRNYLALLQAVSHHPLVPRLFAMNLVVIAILILPVALLYLATRSRKAQQASGTFILALLLLSAFGSAIVGSKVGAGRSHLVPTFILAAYVAALFWRTRTAARPLPPIYTFAFLAYSFVLLIPALSQLRDLWSICYQRRAYALSVTQDLQAIEQRYPPQSLELGYDDQADPNATVSPLTLFKSQVVFAGGPVTVDAAALFDLGLAGDPIPAATLARLTTCQPRTWLIPAGGRPFGLINTYVNDVPSRFPDPSLFGAAFQSTFRTHFQHTATRRYFDIYTCTPH